MNPLYGSLGSEIPAGATVTLLKLAGVSCTPWRALIRMLCEPLVKVSAPAVARNVAIERLPERTRASDGGDEVDLNRRRLTSLIPEWKLRPPRKLAEL